MYNNKDEIWGSDDEAKTNMEDGSEQDNLSEYDSLYDEPEANMQCASDEPCGHGEDTLPGGRLYAPSSSVRYDDGTRPPEVTLNYALPEFYYCVPKERPQKQRYEEDNRQHEGGSLQNPTKKARISHDHEKAPASLSLPETSPFYQFLPKAPASLSLPETSPFYQFLPKAPASLNLPETSPFYQFLPDEAKIDLSGNVSNNVMQDEHYS